jgi:ABC-2 type transport system permease protein
VHDWLTVARWEVFRLLRRKDFIISTLLIPVLVTAGIVITGFMKKRGDAKIVRIAVVHSDGSAATLPALEGFEWITEPRTRDALARLVNDRAIDGAVLIPSDLAAVDTIDALVRWPRQDWVGRVQAHVQREARVARARAEGLGGEALERLDRKVALAERVTQSDRGGSRMDRAVAIGTIVLIVMSLFTAISYMGIGISGEKQARVTEVIVSAITPQSWIDGKIAAYTAVGLGQAAVWGVTALGAIVFFTATIPGAVSPAGLGVSLLFAAAGFAFFIAMLAMVMATIKDLQSTTKFQAYMLFIPFLPLMFMDQVIQNPDAPWVVAISLLPIFSPMLVPARFAIGGIAGWEVALAFVLLLAGFYFMRRAAGAAFRIGMLMYGKEISLPELWRWARMG